MVEALHPKRLKKAERRQQILLELRLKPHVRVSELASQFSVTTETIRRDMEQLSREGLLRRAHGGASPAAPGVHRDMDERRLERVAERERLGRFAASLITDGATIMIDSGTTTMELARALAFAERRVTAITNSLQVAMMLGQSPVARVLLAPGTYIREEAATVGPEACEYLSGYNVDACFLGAAGLDEAGATEAVEGFDAIKRAMMRQSTMRHFLIDSSKFGRTYLSRVARCDEIGALVTDSAPTGALARALGAETRVLVPSDRPLPDGTH
ncbi:DeoR/GlpR family DNA-binding transcription regulator [Allosediminivita pacifica]|uniref:DeoR family transcriptional regulator n=1 Tax=Allosediminivita pacifica TaxID=1267769 RepID=A0A2T6AJD9_9RHOB|nr:DeoR/GlpR family DNA-binding transcription regulator [Allosediminivita pacifica]PTX43939.1 DeoR family transcriptional regulator [Allosediminivita pacifica]GGB21534.1 DeoR family transcriptional regulator [Allosediminivita pacifica]